MKILPGSRRKPSTVPTTWELGIARRVATRLPASTYLRFGVPSHCPQCEDYGYIDDVDSGRGVSQHHCPSCGAVWVLTRRGIAAVNAERSLRAPRRAAAVHVPPAALVPRLPSVAFTDAA